MRGEWVTKIDFIPSAVKLDVMPIDVDSVVVKYFDSNNAEQTLASTEYFVRDPGPDAFATIEFNGNIPAVYSKKNAVSIEYTAGYLTVPAPIKTAILMQVATLYENRQNEVVGASANVIAFGTQSILFPYKMMFA